MDNLPKTKKSLGQHWLTDATSLLAMIEAVAVSPHDTVVEIGPGPGTLTKPLTETAEQVIAIEFDTILAANLGAKVGASNLTVIHDDILRFDFSTVPAPYKVVANIPYYLTSNLIRRMSESANPPVAAALLVQKEVAERVAAKPGSMSLLSVTAQFYWDVSLAMKVPAHLFKPAPKVDSQILIMERLPSERFDDVDPKAFFRLVKAGFSERRKTLSNSLSGGLRLSKADANALLDRAGIEQRLRPQNLSLQDWHKLYKVL